MDTLSVIILAAGKGTRMKSDLPKVLHPVAGTPMVNHVVASAYSLCRDNIHVVVGHQAEKVRQVVSERFDVSFALQTELLGTGDAVKAALPDLAAHVRDVLVLCGDVPLIQPQTLESLVKTHGDTGAKVTVLAVDVEDPTGYGRIIRDSRGHVVAIREEADASAAEKAVRTVNTGIYCFDRGFLEIAVEALQPENSQAEYYLTDVIQIAFNQGEKIEAVTMADPRQVIGVNTREELEKAAGLIDRITNELP